MPTSGFAFAAANGSCGSARQSFEFEELVKVTGQEEACDVKRKALERLEWLELHPNILLKLDTFFALAKGKRVAVFLDYDGTLTPIVNDHNRAFMAQPMRDAVRQIARLFPTAIISGRGREKVQDFVKLKELYYAGSHGMDILGPQERAGPGGGEEAAADLAYQPALDFVPLIEDTHAQLLDMMKPFPKSSVEHNKFCLSVHFRNVDPVYHERLKKVVEDLTIAHPELQLKTGRKVLEVRPKIAWHKGNALTHLLKALDLNEHDNVLPIYMGDDKTDEDAFQVLRERDPPGVGILVSSIVKPTQAQFTLENPKEVMDFLEQLVAWGQTSANGWHSSPSCNGWQLQDGPAEDIARDGMESAGWPPAPSNGEGVSLDNMRSGFDPLASCLGGTRRSSGLGRPPRPSAASYVASVHSMFASAGGADLSRQNSGGIPPIVLGNMSWEGISSLQGAGSTVSELPDEMTDFESTPPSISMLSGTDSAQGGGESPLSTSAAPTV